MRGREVFRSSQPRPVERFVAPQQGWHEAEFASAFSSCFGAKLCDLTTDPEAFNTDAIT